MNRKYGWIPQLPDQRDRAFFAAIPTSTLPPHVDLRSVMPPVYDQGQLGSCTANAIAGALEHQYMAQKLPEITPSRLFIYYNERVVEHTVRSDSGAQIRDGIKSIAQKGDCPESEWPYDVERFAQKPPPKCYSDGLKEKVLTYEAIAQDIGQMKACLAAGFPFVLGFTVYDSFESDVVAKTGILNLPKQGETVVGGHAVLAVGYDDTTKRLLVRNSWGPTWGQAGYFTMPYAYILDPDLASDFWVVKLVS